MTYREVYEAWLNNPYFDEQTKEELRSIANDEDEIKDRFYRELLNFRNDALFCG